MKSTAKSAQPTSATMPLSHGVGRRKKSVARVWLKKGTGKITINGRNIDQYFDTLEARLDARAPFTVIPEAVAYDANINVKGGGRSGQADAIKLGIARAIVAADPDMRPELKKHKLLRVDARVKERKKYGQRGARRKFQFVKR